jgi:hypothetical protein
MERPQKVFHKIGVVQLIKQKRLFNLGLVIGLKYKSGKKINNISLKHSKSPKRY